MKNIQEYVENVLQPKLQGDGGWIQCRRPFFLHFLSTKFVYATKPLMEIQVDCVTRCKYRIETVK